MNFVPQADFKIAHRAHRERVNNAKATIDNSSPLLDINAFARLPAVGDDVHTRHGRNMENFHLLIDLNKLVRTRGHVDSFRTKKTAKTADFSQLPAICRKLNYVDMANMTLGKRLICQKCTVDTWQDIDEYKKKVKRKIRTAFQLPTLLLSKYSNLKIPEPPIKAKKYFQPKIWFCLEVKGFRPLGRIVMELYTVAAPQVVLEFVRSCYFKQKENLNFVRLFPSLWLQGELTLTDDSLMRKRIEYDKRCLDNGQHAGILSFSVKTLRRCASNFVPFSISFKPLSVCNGLRVGFGRICSGLKILSGIEYWGTKNGKPKKEIIVSGCGLM